MAVSIKKFKALNKGALQASFSLELTTLGMTINNCSYFNSNGNSWISMPSKPYESEGKTKYFPLVSFEKERMESLNKLVLPMLEKEMSNPADSSPYEPPDDLPF